MNNNHSARDGQPARENQLKFRDGKHQFNVLNWNSQEGRSLLDENSQEGRSLLDENSYEGTSLPAENSKEGRSFLTGIMNVIRLSGALPAELDIYTVLKENQLAHFYEPAPGLFIAESPQVIRMALEAGYTPESFLLEEGTEERFFKKLDSTGNSYVNREGGALRVYTAPHEALAHLTGYELTGGALAAFRRKTLPQPAELLKDAKRVTLLEHVMNPRNIGSVFRSAAALGFDAVLLTKDSCDPLYRRAARVSMGTVFQIPWTFTGDAAPLKENGFITVAMALTDDSVPMDDPVLKGHEKLAVLMGSERTGLMEETIKNADYTAKIPMKHGVDSLNVAAATAVAFWELRK